MRECLPNAEAVVGYVEDLLRYSKPDCVLTMTIVPENSGGYCVLTATAALSDGIDVNLVPSSSYYLPHGT